MKERNKNLNMVLFDGNLKSTNSSDLGDQITENYNNNEYNEINSFGYKNEFYMFKDKNISMENSNNCVFNKNNLFEFVNENNKMDFTYDSDKMNFTYENVVDPSLIIESAKQSNIHSNALNVSYRPKNVRKEGQEREGQCHICEKWFKLKTSSYWYHMNYKHGINKNNFIIPKSFTTRNNGIFLEAYCKKCKHWVQINTKNKNKMFGWRRHWQKYHTIQKPKNFK
ncbi:meu26 [Ecytonucleospora hepatopenaei]|uniref:Meu26 n=1 Tax=Ecytonucleospora hepatopenaei TaxID=646526 RepID=A0A1W0E3F2_9MICR|nr:meu26 [Ecytonucleospora hepatopenaei]